MTTQRDIRDTWVFLLLITLLGALAAVGLISCLSGCPSVTPTPVPVTPIPEPPAPTPEPTDPPGPGPAPAATPCERACANADRHHCESGGPLCVRACDRDQQLGGEFDRHPECQAAASGPNACAAIEACRGGQ